MQFCNSLCWSGFAIVCIARDQSRRSRRHQESNKAPLRSEIVPQLDVLPRCTIILVVCRCTRYTWCSVLGSESLKVVALNLSLPGNIRCNQISRPAIKSTIYQERRQCKIVGAMMEWTNLYCQKSAYLHDGVYY